MIHGIAARQLSENVIAGFLNSTQILIDRYTLYVRHRPIPWLRNRELPRSEIQGIETEFSYTQDYQPKLAISAHHTDGRQIVLPSGGNERQARYIAYHIADCLGVKYTRNDSESQSGRRRWWPGRGFSHRLRIY